MELGLVEGASPPVPQTELPLVKDTCGKPKTLSFLSVWIAIGYCQLCFIIVQ